VLAAAAIAWAALPRLASPQPIDAPALGIAISLLASAVNFGTARVLLAAAQRHHSIALEADARHLMTDVWTTAGVLCAVGLVAATGWLILDPLIALAVAAHIVWIGVRLMRRSFAGLMDAAIAGKERDYVDRILAEYAKRYAIGFHALRTRQAGARRFVSFHMLVPDDWSVARAHQLSEEIEMRIRELVPNASILTHIEPISEPASYDDIPLDR
jgi:cation diffusion facilitator family transporter